MAAAWHRRLAALLLLWGLACAAQAACPGRTEVASAQRSVTDAAGTRSAMVALPDTIPAAWRNEQVRIRYRIEVGDCAGPDAALWLFRVGAPYRLTTDAGRPLPLISTAGRPLGARRDADVLHNGRIPALYAVPAGVQSVLVELLAPPYLPAGIVRAEIGPSEALLPVQADAFDAVVAFADASSGVVLVLGALALMLWTQRRSDRSLLWLAVACGTWGLRGMVYAAPVLPLPPGVFEQFNALQVLLTSTAVAFSLFAILGITAPAAHRLLWGATLACVLLFVATALADRGAAVARTLNFGVGFVIVSTLMVLVWRRRAQLARWHFLTFLGGFGLLLGCAVHDMMIVFGALPPDEPSYVFWGFVLLLLGFAAMSGQYVVLTLNRAERANEELEAHVRRKTGELEQSYARLRETEHEAARTQERERLLRDMHDGLGAQLMTMLRGVEREALPPAQLKQSLQDSIDELRLLMDSTDLGHYLPGALAAWRNRWDHRLQAAGVTLEWHIGDGLDDVQLTGEVALQVMRILQEAAANIVKHAQARRMVLDAQVRPQAAGATLCIAIRDDGRGLQLRGERAGGRGLANMRYRAAQIGADLAVGPRSDGPGTEVVLWLPLPAGQATSPRRAASMAASAREEIPSLR